MESFITFENIRRYILLVLEKIKVDTLSADSCAESLAEASLKGIDSHGIRLLPHYVDAVLNGRIVTEADIKIECTTPCIAKMDAKHSFAYGSGVRAIDKAIDMAHLYGVGIVGVSNSNHMGGLFHYANRAAQKDMVGLVMTSTTPKMSTPNSKKSFFGTNPICVSAPMMDEEPFCFDAATTILTGNKIKHYKSLNQELPLDAATNIEGKNTIDPNLAYYLKGIGDYKGFGLAMIVDIFSSFLNNMPFASDVSSMYESSPSDKRYLGHFFMALNISAFDSTEVFKQNLQKLCEQIRNSERVDAMIPVYVPGDKEKQTKEQRLMTGIPVSSQLTKQFVDIAQKLNISTQLLNSLL
ncbi:Ldh family oxidoreductase [Bernardetia sp. MNP-M8]|uniref:Ldh family oxidoreductase n=1 Tax=Bernardetia sp. MNP-M8 TaxID=3127470 RepID=UPI0030CCF3F3